MSGGEGARTGVWRLSPVGFQSSARCGLSFLHYASAAGNKVDDHDDQSHDQ
jgi:hypothetical protein